MIVVHNTPQVQLGVEQRINEILQVAENMHLDQVVQVIPLIIEQPVEQHNPQENVGATLRRSTRERKSTIPSDLLYICKNLTFELKMILSPFHKT